MAISKNKKTGIWYIDIRHAGERIYRSTGTKDKESAQRYHDQIKKELWDQDRLSIKPKYTWQDAVIRWLREASHKKSLKDDLGHLRWVDPYLSNLMLHQVTRDVIENIAVEKEKTDVGPATVNRMLAVIRAILNKACHEWEWIEKSPKVRMRQEPPGRTRWLPPKDVIALLKELPEHTRYAFIFSIATGLRKTNVLGLKWEKVDMENRYIEYLPGVMKGGKAHGVAISDVAMKILLEQQGKHPTYVFTYKGKNIKECAARAWRNALERAGIEDFRWHDLRHTSTSWLAQMDVSDSKLQNWGNWSDRKMPAKYAHLRRKDSAETADKISQVLLPICNETKEEEK